MATTHSDERLNQTVTSGQADLGDLRARLISWLAGRPEVAGSPSVAAEDSAAAGGSSGVEVGEVTRPEASGMSNISILFDASWTSAETGVRESARLVARMCPLDDAFPVFPVYDLARQFDAMRVVGEHTDLPVPRVRWLEDDPSVLGAPFLVMDRVSGVAPVDNPPYVFEGWLMEMSPTDRADLQRKSVEVLAAVHGINDPAELLPSLAPTAGLRAHVDEQREYYEWTIREGGPRIPVIEKAFYWIEAHWPAEVGPDVLCWGDSRIGNILYEGTTPNAVLDWEMATLAPAEVDLGWFLYFHDLFQDLAVTFGFPGIPDLFDHDQVVAQYEQASGTVVRDLQFYYTYAGLRQGLILARIHRRRIEFGEAEATDNPDDYVLHNTMLYRLIAD